MEGVGWHHINVVDGERFSCLRAYYEPAVRRPNVSVSLNSYATRLLFSGKRCVGVEYLQDGKVRVAHAAHEVIVCNGAIESPKLLLLSGIGNPSALKEFGIPVAAEVPGVGENFHNHVLTGLIYEMSQPVPPGRQNLSEAALFWKSEPGWLGPDLQFAFVHVPFSIIVGEGHPNSVSILPGVVRPMSRGWLRLASSNPLDPPLINPNYLGDRSDASRLVQCLKMAREIFAAQAFSRWAKEELMPGPEYQTDEQLMAFAKQSADSYHHQAGSCKMGVDDMAVVDPSLRVYGAEGLRVCDASAMPMVPSGNCYVGIVMMAEKVCDLIKKDYGL
jgi:choline dehydrogenase